MVRAEEDSKVLEQVRDVVDNIRVGVQGKVDNKLVQVVGNKLQEEVQAEVGEVAQHKVEDSKVQVRGRAHKWALGKEQDIGRPALGLVHEQALGVVLVPELGQ